MNVHIYPSYFTNESRILRIVGTLHAHRVFDEILIIAIRRADLPEKEELDVGIRVVRVAPHFGQSLTSGLGSLIKGIGWYFAVLKLLFKLRLECVNCHSLTVLPIGFLAKLFCGCRLIYDTHELETETVASRGFRRFCLKLIERLLIGQCDAVSVVNQSIADWYQKRYRLSRVWIVRNIPYSYPKNLYHTGLLRNAIGLMNRPECILYLYQGFLTVGRSIHMMLEVFSKLGEPYHLVIMGYGELESIVRHAEATHKNIHFIPAVPTNKVFEYTVDADVGLALIENVCLSYYYSLPNKVFEYAICGVPCLVSDFPEMAQFIDESGFGWKISPDAKSLENQIRATTHKIIEEKKKQIRNSYIRFGWEFEEIRLLEMYDYLGLYARKNKGTSSINT